MIEPQKGAKSAKLNAQHKIINPRQLRSHNFLQFTKTKFIPGIGYFSERINAD